MSTSTMTMDEIRRTGIQALTDSLGAVGMVRFLQQSDVGWGDYTKERHQWLKDDSLSDIAKGIQAMKNNATKS